MSIRFRIPSELADRLRGRAHRENVPSSTTMALLLLARAVDADLRGAPPPARRMAPPPETQTPDRPHTPPHD